jgi:hypothetical protein
MASGGQLVRARNELCRIALDDADIGWLWFIDDDHVFDSAVVQRLLAHDKDIIVPLTLQRMPPHNILAWPHFDVPPTATDDELVTLTRANLHRPFEVAPGTRGPVELSMAATAGMLIRREVLERLPAPWFESNRFEADGPGSDTWFCLKARRAGFRVWCDVDTPMGHLTTCAVRPTYDPASGQTRFDYQLLFTPAEDATFAQNGRR